VKKEQPMSWRAIVTAGSALLFILLLWRNSSSTPNITGEYQESLRSNANPSGPTPKSGHLFYFAYASDLLEERVRKGSSKAAKKVVAASIPGLAFDYPIFSKTWKGGVADLVPTNNDEDKAWGMIWEFPNVDIANLDSQKGIEKADPKYKKIQVVAVSEDGEKYPAFTYILHDEKRTHSNGSPNGVERFAPSKQYRRCILKGAKEARLPASYQSMLKGIADNGEEFKRKSVGKACD